MTPYSFWYNFASQLYIFLSRIVINVINPLLDFIIHNDLILLFISIPIICILVKLFWSLYG